MVSSNVDIASQALGLLRANTISSFDDGSNEADIVSLYYDDFMQDILTRYPWSFATKKRLLNQTTAPINEFRYAHIMPAEALRLWALFATDAVGAKPINKFDIQAPTGGRRILSNNSVLYGEYTVYTAESNMPGYFTHFAIHAFAALIAMPVTDDDALAEKMQRLAWGPPSDGEKGGKFSVACGIDAQQKPPEEILSSPLIDARFS
ncbi:MAG: hypothetical protein ACPGQQ_00815 [Candidatus Puniceispirillaceae bacterium]